MKARSVDPTRSSLISSVESISKKLEKDIKLETKRNDQRNSLILINEREATNSKTNDKILLISSSKSNRVKSQHCNDEDEEDSDHFWIDSGKTRLGIQFER